METFLKMDLLSVPKWTADGRRQSTSSTGKLKLLQTLQKMCFPIYKVKQHLHENKIQIHKLCEIFAQHKISQASSTDKLLF